MSGLGGVDVALAVAALTLTFVITPSAGAGAAAGAFATGGDEVTFCCGSVRVVGASAGDVLATTRMVPAVDAADAVAVGTLRLTVVPSVGGGAAAVAPAAGAELLTLSCGAGAAASVMAHLARMM